MKILKTSNSKVKKIEIQLAFSSFVKLKIKICCFCGLKKIYNVQYKRNTQSVSYSSAAS